MTDPERLRELPAERLVSLQKFHHQEAVRMEREAKRHRSISNAMVDEVGRRLDERKAKA